MTTEIDAKLREIEAAKWCTEVEHALVQALRYSIHSMLEYSQQYDFDTDSEIQELAKILSAPNDKEGE